MRIVVDPDRCEGHSRCWALAPDLFDIDDYGNATATETGPLAADQETRARLAIANCPEHAISIRRS